MSSEETLSAGGSEEVRALEYDDMGVVSESSGLERTEEEVGGNEVAEVEGEEAPANILEVGDRIDRCYDIRADIVSEVRGYETELWPRDSLSYLVETYEIPPQVLIRLVGVEERACSAPHVHWMPVSDVIEAAELYGPSSLSEAEMDKFLATVGGMAIPKKPRKKSK
ncbi:hypothetical protein SLEP1_g51811 [Rubroshorea leprosula]|uniref:Uncharacterized protein n=1 Tax=Rubroshorea leprosula TaxID=152421 RepID=A0AAV5M4F0_9ROSI|nr:hypothetical protein SLEP1_g51811 [Rubroshorea leprosula]